MRPLASQGKASGPPSRSESPGWGWGWDGNLLSSMQAREKGEAVVDENRRQAGKQQRKDADLKGLSESPAQRFRRSFLNSISF